ncbi:unnamed protein product [Polarella glacialis]|uniref:BACK domain-containing protein n=1 Tax=Polarella glacialis TaxID=89957 RepID=A0A813F4I9_POLGL|nr:unnamed protein product [Polarella glacialis]
MAKLFEEVSGASGQPSSSCDIIIYFGAPGPEAIPALLSTPPAASPSSHLSASPGGGESRSGQHGSPRMSAAQASRAASPAAVSPRRAASSCPAELNPTAMPLRCHTLVLRTQPVLLERLLLPDTRRGHGRSIMEVAPAIAGGSACVEPPPASAAAAAAAAAVSAAAWPDNHSGGAASACAETASAGAASVDRNAETMGMPPASASPVSASCPRADEIVEVIVDDEPEVFLDMIKFVYLNTCDVDQNNVKALMHIADKYCIEDMIKHCLKWMQDHFTATLFYHALTFQLCNERFGDLLRQNLQRALRSRRHFTQVISDSTGQWENLTVSFVEAMLSEDELPVVSEMEVLHLLARWARGALARRDEMASENFGTQRVKQLAEAPCAEARRLDRNAEAAMRSTAAITTGSSFGDHTDNSSDAGPEKPCADVVGDSEGGDGEAVSGTGGKDSTTAPTGSASDGIAVDCLSACSVTVAEQLDSDSLAQTREDMLRLLRAVRKTNMHVELSDVDTILQILGLDKLFSSKPPRESSALDPGFMIYRGVAGVNVPASFGELHQLNAVPHAWKGGSVSLGSHDFLQQQDGFRPKQVPEGGETVFPRLCVRINCSSWSHREKRTSKSAASLSRHNSLAAGLGADVSAPTGSWETVSMGPGSLMGLASLNEEPGSGGAQKGAAPRLKTSQDDWEVGRKAVRTGPALTDNEKIDHKVVCAVISGHVRHGIRIGQRERSSIYDIEELTGQCEDVALGGTSTEVEFELLLKVQAPDVCGICKCTLAVLPPESLEPLLEVSFDASAEEHLHFYLSSSYFDTNSSYTVALNWLLRPGLQVHR